MLHILCSVHTEKVLGKYVSAVIEISRAVSLFTRIWISHLCIAAFKLYYDFMLWIELVSFKGPVKGFVMFSPFFPSILASLFPSFIPFFHPCMFHVTYNVNQPIIYFPIYWGVKILNQYLRALSPPETSSPGFSHLVVLSIIPSPTKCTQWFL